MPYMGVTSIQINVGRVCLMYALTVIGWSSWEFLSDDVKCIERGTEWPAMVQDQHKARKALLWSSRLASFAENFATVAELLSSV